jgi:RNA polymerase sigma-70 factor (ECF subfamily)
MEVRSIIPTTPTEPSERGRLADGDSGGEQSERLLALEAKHDPEAFALLYRRYVRTIHAFAYRRSGSREVAEDVTSATFERAWRAMPTFEWRGGGFEPWLFRIAANEIAGYFRNEHRATTPRAQAALRELAPQPPLDALPDFLEASGLTTGAVLTALSTLRPRYQDAISLRFLSGLTPADAAQALGCSTATASVILHRALRALRRALQQEGTPR